MTQPMALGKRGKTEVAVQTGVVLKRESLFDHLPVPLAITHPLLIDSAAQFSVEFGNFVAVQLGRLFEEFFIIVHARLIGAGKQTLRPL